ncbi:MAG: hypothetical protein PHE49_11035, partial [bacterium]|nr:hypothetical protein [bacterium]
NRIKDNRKQKGTDIIWINRVGLTQTQKRIISTNERELTRKMENRELAIPPERDKLLTRIKKRKSLG